jgi:hypothetical protein
VLDGKILKTENGKRRSSSSINCSSKGIGSSSSSSKYKYIGTTIEKRHFADYTNKYVYT